jgi:hypothetical protein
MSTQQYTFDVKLFSDLHKDTYGKRPNQQYFEWLSTTTDAEKQVEWDRLIVIMTRCDAT